MNELSTGDVLLIAVWVGN